MDLDDRMHGYFKPFDNLLPPRTNIVLRVDGRAFHTYTRGLKRPFDEDFMQHMDLAAIELLKQVQGAKCAYVQSDEVSILYTTYDTSQTQPWLGNRINKVISHSAAIMTSYFNDLRKDYHRVAQFDSRAGAIHLPIEVNNYFIYRQQDAVRNSIQSLGQSFFSQKQLHGKGTNEIQDMVFLEHGVNWNNLHPHMKRGRFIVKKEFDIISEYNGEPIKRKRWVVEDDTPDFSKNIHAVLNLLPNAGGTTSSEPT